MKCKYISPSSLLVSFVWTRGTIHISPNGTDSRECGSNTTKCQSIDHALNLLIPNLNDLHLILESHPSRHLAYKIEKIHLLQNLTSLSIRKDQSQNQNPTIHGNDINGVFVPGKRFHLQIQSVNLEHFQLFSTKHTATVSLTLDVNDSVIRRHSLTISSFINDKIMWKLTAGEAYFRYMELINKSRRPPSGMYLNPLDVQAERSNRIPQFFKWYIHPNTRMPDVKSIHDLIYKRKFGEAKKLLPRGMSNQKFNQLKKLVFEDRDSTTFLKVNLAKGSKITFRNCSMIFGGRIGLSYQGRTDDGGQSVFFLEGSTVAGFLEMKLRRVSHAVVKNCVFRNIVSVQTVLIEVTQCKLRFESSSLRLSFFQNVIAVYDSNFTVKSVDLTNLSFKAFSWGHGLFIASHSSVAYIVHLTINDIFSGWGSVLTSSKTSSTTIEDVRVENSSVGQYFRFQGNHTSVTNVSFVKCKAMVFFHFKKSVVLDNFHTGESKARLRFLENFGASVLIRNSKFNANSAATFADLFRNSKLTLRNCEFTKNQFILYLIECKRESSVGSFQNQISGNTCDGLFRASASSNITSEGDLITDNKFNQNVFEIVHSRAILLDTGIKSNWFRVFVRSFAGSSAFIDSVIYQYNNVTGEGHFARIVNSAMNLTNTVIVSENSGNSVLNIFTSRFSSVNTSILIEGSNAKQIPVLRWNVERKVSERRKNLVQLKMSCPQNFNFVNKTNIERDYIDYEISCQSCSKGTFSLVPSQMFITSEIISEFSVFTAYTRVHEEIIDKLFGYNVAISPVVCQTCPPGGVCETKIRSRKNFYGFTNTGNGYLEFIQCPSGYCCSSKEECKTIKSCRQHRTGRLCGRCEAGYQISYATNKCVKSHRCTLLNQIVFWIGFFVLTIILAFVLSFARMIKDGIKIVFRVKDLFLFS